FSVCPAQNAGNFAVWTGPATGWRQIGALAGDLNTMIIKDSLLYIGGGFSYIGKVANVVSWHRSSGFDTFATHLNNEVMDFEVYLDTLYASCKLTSPNDHHLISRLINGTWDTSRQVNLDADLVLSVNAICANRDTFIAGGDFHYYPTVMGTEVRDMVDISYLFQSIPRYYLPCVNFISDSTVYCMTRFRNKIFLGGTFTRSTKPYTYVNTNGISTLAIPYWHMFPLKVKIDSIFQGCTKNRLGEVKLDVSGDSPIRLLWSTGDTASFNNVYSSYPVYKDSLVTGSYWVRVQDKWGQVDTFRFTIKNEAVDTAVSLINGYFVKALSGARLQWLDCDNHFNAITGATKPTFKPTVTGNYAVAISVDGCLDTSYCHSYKVTGIKDVQEMSAVLYPNPATDLLNVSFDHLITHAVMDIIDVTGRSVAKQVINNSNEAVVNTRLFVKGVYTVVVRQDGLEPYYMRFIKE
ncbi:MAG: T9SS type A sorting domain-containing protein, partial [Flavipsychrobacter sp.]